MSIESVLIPYGDSTDTMYVSAETACQADCVFCTTGYLAFARILMFFEIVEQLLSFVLLMQAAGERGTNVV
ncbi:MAG: hypothetical protein ABFD13_00195 [Candidatus Cryosericum sp.]|nr:hypothetical protein [bacterium]